MTRRSLPSVTALLARAGVAELIAAHGRPAVVRAARAVLAEARRAGGEGSAVLGAEAIESALREEQMGSLRGVINATGVVLHTNLGRAPLAAAALREIAAVASRHCTLEYDPVEGARGDRHAHPIGLIRELTGAEDAVVVNNNAAALLLTLGALAAGREVIISRGELVEIGGGFRIPDVLTQSGAHLREVGTTNKTYARDYRGALGPASAMLLKVYPSAFTMTGFTHESSIAELAEIGREQGIPVVYDAGSGCLFEDEPGESVGARLREGADLVLFSGDKLLGGPQAGLVVGRAPLVELLRRHPLLRALRPDKLCLAALGATLRLWRDDPQQIPLVRMLRAPAAALDARARGIVARLAARGLVAEVSATVGRVGGGAWPARELPGAAVRLADGKGELARALRRRPLPIVGRVEGGALLLDLRAVEPADDALVEEALVDSLKRLSDG